MRKIRFSPDIAGSTSAGRSLEGDHASIGPLRLGVSPSARTSTIISASKIVYPRFAPENRVSFLSISIIIRSISRQLQSKSPSCLEQFQSWIIHSPKQIPDPQFVSQNFAARHSTSYRETIATTWFCRRAMIHANVVSSIVRRN